MATARLVELDNSAIFRLVLNGLLETELVGQVCDMVTFTEVVLATHRVN